MLRLPRLCHARCYVTPVTMRHFLVDVAPRRLRSNFAAESSFPFYLYPHLICAPSWIPPPPPPPHPPPPLLVPASARMPARTTRSPRAATSPATIPGDTCQHPPRSSSSCSPPRSPVYEYPLNGQWIMMDIDDGYILWTGIWKGASLPRPRHARSSPPPSPRQLQGSVSPPNVPSPYLALFSRHCQDDRFPARPRPRHPSGARRLSQNTGHLDALRGQRLSAISPLRFAHFASLGRSSPVTTVRTSFISTLRLLIVPSQRCMADT